MVQLYAVVTELGEVWFKWFILPRSARTELTKDVLPADIRSGGVQTRCWCVPHVGSISYTFDDAPYFRGAGKSDHRRSLGFLSLPIIIVVIVVEVKWLRFRIPSGNDCVCFHGWQDEKNVVCPLVVVVGSEHRAVTPPYLVEGEFGGSHREIVEMVLRFSALFMRLSLRWQGLGFLRLFLEIVEEIVGKIVRFSIVAITGLITCWNTDC